MGTRRESASLGRAEVHVSLRLWGPSLSPFAVVYDERRRGALRTRARWEVGRTETITHAGSGACRTFLRSFLVRTAKNPKLRVALFDFVDSTAVVDDHVYLGAVTFSLADVLANGAVTLKLPTSQSSMTQIAVILRASRIDDTLYAARRSVALRIVVPEMRRRKFPHQLVNQSFDISRCAATADPAAGPSWIPVYRSEALAAPSTHERHIRFDAAIIPEWRLYGLNTPLRIRLLQHSARSIRVSVAAVCNTSLQELQVLDPSRDSLSLFGARNATTALGRMFLTQAEPTESGGVFSLTAQYNQFSLSGAKRALSLSMTRIATMRTERKYADRRMHDDSSFGSREPASAGSGRSLDRFALKLRTRKTPSDVQTWGTSSGYDVIQSSEPPEPKVPRWRSWLSG